MQGGAIGANQLPRFVIFAANVPRLVAREQAVRVSVLWLRRGVSGRARRWPP
jgi:hypothetical protein